MPIDFCSRPLYPRTFTYIRLPPTARSEPFGRWRFFLARVGPMLYAPIVWDWAYDFVLATWTAVSWALAHSYWSEEAQSVDEEFVREVRDDLFERLDQLTDALEASTAASVAMANAAEVLSVVLESWDEDGEDEDDDRSD